MPGSNCPKGETSNPYDIAQTRKWVQHVRSDFWWLAEMPISGAALSFAIGDTTNTLTLFEVSRMGPKRFARVARIIPEIEARKLCFLPQGSKEHYVWIEPPEKKSIQKLSQKSAWSLSAHCLSCGRDQFLSVTIWGDDRPYAACYSCIPPDQYRSIGAQLAPKSLIHEALKNYC